MELVAVSDFHFGFGNRCEVLRAGDKFTPPGTGVMNRAEHARSLIRTGTCMAADDPKAPAAVAAWDSHREWAQRFIANGRCT